MSYAEQQISKELPQPKGSTNLASLILESHGLKEADYNNVIPTQNFVAGDQLLPEPVGDKYLSSTILPILGEDQTTAVFTQPPGLIEWHADHTTPQGAEIIELNPEYGPNGEIGYPYGDINTQLQQAVDRGEVEFNGNSAFMTTFPDASFHAIAKGIGAEVIQQSAPNETNNKALLRKKAREYGIKMAPGFVLQSAQDIQRAIDEFEDLPHGAWMKVPTGSGGDLVQHIPHVTESALRKVHHVFEEQIAQALSQGTFPQGMYEQYAEKNGFIVESDVRNHTRVIANCSNLMLTKQTGIAEMMGVYGQMTGADGSYIGSRSLFDIPQVQQFMQELNCTQQDLQQFLAIKCGLASEYMKDLQYYGPYGQDFFLVENNGEPDIYFVEFNGRLPISGIGEIMKRNAGVSSFINTNIWTKNGELNTMADLRQALTLDGTDLTEQDPQKGAVYVQAMRAEWTRQNGEMELLQPSNAAKVLFLGNDPEYLDHLQKQLAQKNGISYKPL